MAGADHQIQIRQILVDKKEAADLLMETINTAKGDVPRVKMLMKLAEKYSRCPSKSDGGNMGWIQVSIIEEDSRNPRGGYKGIENEEINKIIHKSVRNGTMIKGVPFGPVKTNEGYHILIIANEFKTDRIL